MQSLAQQRILLGIGGGIAAYKSADLVRRLREQGAEVRVVMTRAAQAFITPLTLQAVSGHPVHTELLDPAAEAGMGHIELARWADRLLIAPATADLMARLAAGLADDLLTTLCLASPAPLVLAPAMNQGMWRHPATQANRDTLAGRGVLFLGPAEGEQACGDIGPGRMLEPTDIVARLTMPAATPLAGVRLMITAGPTREALDPVRYLTNHSSGKMGFALAQAARRAGAEVTLIAGPVSLPTPAGVHRVDVTTALDMHQAVQASLGQCDIFIGAAAVADYRPRQQASDKLKKQGDAPLVVEFEQNPDIIASVAAHPARPFTVGFAAETRDVLDYARDKLRRKGLDMIIANDVSLPGLGFNSDDNAVTALWDDGHHSLGPAPKRQLAEALVALIARRAGKGSPAGL